VCWAQASRKWRARIRVNDKVKDLGLFEATARGEVDAALAVDFAARTAGRPEKATFETPGARAAVGSRGARPSLEEAQGQEALSAAGCGGSSPGAAPTVPQEAGTGQALPGADLGALAAQIARRGLVRRDNAFSSRHTGVSWHKTNKKWRAKIRHGGERESLGYFATEAGAKARYDARRLELGIDADALQSSDFRGVGCHKTDRKWKAQIRVDGKRKNLGTFEATARGEVDAALAFDAAVRAAGRPEKANFENLGAAAEEAQGQEALPTAGGSGSSPGAAHAPREAWAGQALPGFDLGALAAEVARRGLVRRDNNAFSSRHTGVSWHKQAKKWRAEVAHDGKREYLGLFATEAEARARHDARCKELGRDPDAGTSSGFCGVGWDKRDRKWWAEISLDGKRKGLGTFEATARGEVDAALAYDRATRAAGRPEKANFAAGGGDLESDALAQPPAAIAEAPRVPVGTEIRKVFDGVAYRGQVISFDPERKLYAVQYDDGDSEELTEEEVRSHGAAAHAAAAAAAALATQATPARGEPAPTKPVHRAAHRSRSVYHRDGVLTALAAAEGAAAGSEGKPSATAPSGSGGAASIACQINLGCPKAARHTGLCQPATVPELEGKIHRVDPKFAS
jgi:hypothetical protein